MSGEVQAKLGTTCKGSGSFYVCDKKPSKFIGCCSVDACKTDDGVCPDDDLLYTSYDKLSHNMIGPQACQSDDPEVRWWTCAGPEIPFMGCCAINPCERKDGCPSDKLFAAKLSEIETDAAVFLPASSTAKPGDDDGDDGGLSKGAIGGIAAGAAVAGLLIIAGIVYFFLRRRRRNQTPATSYEPYSGQQQQQQQQQSFAGSNPQSPEMQKARFSSYSPYASTHASPGLPQGAQPSPPYWKGSHNGQYGPAAPSPYSGHMGSPDPSQGQQFQHGGQPAYGGGSNFVQELPGGAGDMPNVSDLSYKGAPGRESEVSGMSGWTAQQQQVAEMEASNYGPGGTR